MNGTTVVIGVRYFRVERPWGILPAGRSLGAVSELALDSKGNAGPCALCFTAASDRIQGSAVETAGARPRNKVRIAGTRLEAEPIADGVARPGDDSKRQQRLVAPGTGTVPFDPDAHVTFSASPVPSVGLQSATGGLSTNHRSSVTEVAS